jgi:hypothetical protein
MMDSTLPLTILDYEEFGDPNISTEFDTIRSYSPYDNLSPDICYPPVLVTASFNDTRFCSTPFATLEIHFRTLWIKLVLHLTASSSFLLFLLSAQITINFLVNP